MSHFICSTCGTQFAASAEPPDACSICEDERQFVGWEGQRWTTLDELRADHTNVFDELEPNLVRLGTRPEFAIGQHAHLVVTPGGNLLWDCIALIDRETVGAIESLGGVSAIAISHPHYYSTMLEWSRAFGGAPIFLHAADARWIARTGPEIELWTGEQKPLHDGLTLIRGGGHFDGGTMLHWPAGGDGNGALLAGDIIQVVHDTRWVSFMWSYVNYVPLSAPEVERVAASVEPFEFERIYSPWLGRVVRRDGKDVVRRSARRYIEAISS